MSALTKQHKEFIVRRLAAFASPSAIITEFMKRFPGVACTEVNIAAANPLESVVDPDLHALFYSERELNMADPSRSAFASQAARIFALSTLAERLFANNQPHDARSVLRQIAEEQGAVGSKTGQREATTPPGEKVTEITRTIVDPVAPDAVA